MSAGTYSALYPSGVNLVTNPATVTSSGTIVNASGAALVGTYGTIVNDGTIVATGGDGIDLSAGGTIVDYGIIGGTATAIYLGTEASDRLVLEGNYVIDGNVVVNGSPDDNVLELAAAGGPGAMSGLAGKFQNFGTVVVDAAAEWTLSASNTIGLGVTLTDSGVLTNAGAMLVANGGTFLVDPATFVNSGYMSGAVTLAGGSYLDNTATGTIVAAGYAVYGANSPNTVVNAGTIVAQDGYGVELLAGGSVGNSGLISGYSGGIYISGAAGTVGNTGTIDAVNGNGVVLGAAGYTGNAGTIEAGGYGIFGASSVVNSGTIRVDGDAHLAISMPNGGYLTNQSQGYVYGGASVNGGSVRSIANQGTIVRPDGNAAFVQYGFIDNQPTGVLAGATGAALNFGTLVNAGVVSGLGADATAVVLSISGLVDNAPAGTIVGGGGAVYLASGAFGTVLNSGVISGTGDASNGVLLSGGGIVRNAGGGSIAGFNAGVAIDFAAATVSNYGTIFTTGEEGFGVRLYRDNAAVANGPGGVIVGGLGGIYASYASASVSNAGTVLGTNGDGIYLSAGYVTNASTGLVSGTQNGIAANDGLTVANSGTIGGADAGISLTGYGTIANSGAIAGTFGAGILLGRYYYNYVSDQGYFYGGGSVSNSAGGLISGSDGIRLYGDSSVVNAGTIFGASGYGAALSDGGAVTNASAGYIYGNDTGVAIGDNPGTVTNYGTITGHSGDGVFLGYGGLVANASNTGLVAGYEEGVCIAGALGTVTNLGTIASTEEDGTGVMLGDGGTVSNASGALIAGYYGISVSGYSGSVFDAGTISGSRSDDGVGIRLSAGGYVTIASGGIVTGYGAVAIDGAGGTLVNAGLLSSYDNSTYAVRLFAGGSVTNQSGGDIYGGISVEGDAGVVVNAGTVADPGIEGAGVRLEAGGYVNNQANGYISAGYGVFIDGGDGTVVNGGTIVGRYGVAVYLGGDSNLLALDPGYALGGVAEGFTDSYNALELAPDATVGALTGLGVKFENFGAVTVDPGADWTLPGYNTIGVGVTLTDNGTLSDTGTLINAGSLLIPGSLIVDPATLINSGYMSGGVTLAGGSYLDNMAGGTIVAAGTAVLGTTSPNTVANYGTIAAGDADIDFTAGGVVTNAASGRLFAASGDGILVSGASGTVSNAGTIAAGGDAVYLYGGGSVTNSAGGSLSAGGDGVSVQNAAGTVVNYGGIAADFTGVILAAGGNVVNASGADIAGRTVGIDIANNYGTVGNLGTITAGANYTAVDLSFGGVVDNGVAAGGGGARISGGYGVEVGGGAGTVANLGTVVGSHIGVFLANGGTIENGAVGAAHPSLIAGTGSAGVLLNTGGSVLINAAAGDAITGYRYGTWLTGPGGTVVNAGTIAATGSAGYGIDLTQGGTVIDSGTIAGAAASVFFGAASGNRLVLDPGYGLAGAVANGTDAILELAAGASAGTIGAAIGDFTTIDVDAAARWQVSGAPTLASFAAIYDYGSLGVTANLSNPNGYLEIGLGATLGLYGTVTGAGYIDFLAGTGELAVGAAPIGNTIRYFGPGDEIDFADFAFGASTSASYSSSTHLLTVSGGAGSASLTMSGIIVGTRFLATSDGRGGTLIEGYMPGGGSTFSGTITSGIVLSSNVQNPASVLAGAYVTNTTANHGGIALYGSANYPWTVSNYGTLNGHAGAAGADLTAGGSISNALAGVIAGGVFGIDMTTSAGAVTNRGTIVAAASGNAVDLGVGGSVNNASGGLIAAGHYAVDITNRAGTVINQGTIAATGSGGLAIDLTAGGIVVNQSAGALIAETQNGAFTPSDNDGISIGGGLGTVVNFGTIVGRRDLGVYLAAGGFIANSSGLIDGIRGVYIRGATGSVSNAGTITGSYLGVYISSGQITNSGLIDGSFGAYIKGGSAVLGNAGTIIGTSGAGVDLVGGGTVVDSGTVVGGAGVAIALDGTGNNRLIIAPGYRIVGSATAAGSGNTLELAAAVAAAGTVSALATQFYGFAQVTVDAGATWSVAGNIGSGTTLTDLGTLGGSVTIGSSGAAFISAGGIASNTVVVSGGFELIYGVVNAGEIESGGVAVIESHGTAVGMVATNAGPLGSSVADLEVDSGGVASNTTIGSGGALELFGGALLAGTTTIGSGGEVLVFSGEVLSGLGVQNGVLAEVLSGGATNGMPVASGGNETALSGGTVSGAIIAGGTIDVQAGGAVSGAVTFAGGTTGGRFTAGGTTLPLLSGGNVVSGFAAGDTIDLAALGLASVTSYGLTSGNVFDIAISGGQTYAIDFAPAQNFSGENFVLTSDGTSGTDIGLQAGSNTVSFSDLFSPAASSAWNNFTGGWTTSGGTYYATAPNNNPAAVTLLPYNLSDLTVTVTVNNVGDGGILLHNDYQQSPAFSNNPADGVELIIGGDGYGQGSRGGGAGNSIYWADADGSVINAASGVVTPGGTYTVTVTVQGDLYSAYLNGSSTPVTTLTYSGAPSGDVGLYDDQPNTTTGAGSGPPTTFSDFSLQGISEGLLVGGTLTSGIVLSSSLQNPATIVAGALVTNVTGSHGGTAVYATNAATWTLSNYGTILNSATAGAGVSLDAGGIARNFGLIDSDNSDAVDFRAAAGPGTLANFGTITTGANGTRGQAVYLGTGGLVTNYALITGAHPGTPPSGTAGGYPGVIEANNTAATVVNFGTITNPNNGNGVNLLHGGVVINGSGSEPTALISVPHDGIYIGGRNGTPYPGAFGTVVNYGTIAGSELATAGSAIVFASGGTVLNHGVIEDASNNGLNFRPQDTAGAPGTVVNFGTIATGAAGSSGEAIYLGTGGVITNYALISGVHPGTPVSGTTGGYPGVVQANNTRATLVNFGTIATATDGNGVNLLRGGLLINGSSGETSALIDAPHRAIYMGGRLGVAYPGAVGTLVNYGTIIASGVASATTDPAVQLTAGGTVVNAGLIENFATSHSTFYSEAGGVITNAAGGTIVSPWIAIHFGDTAGTTVSFGTVLNSGTIESTGATAGDGILLSQGGTLANAAGGLIAGHYGVAVRGGAGTITNAGTIVGAGSSGAAVSLSAGSTLVNAGTIANSGGTAVALTGGGNRLVVNPGATFVGYIDGGGAGASNDTVELAAGSGSGTIANNGLDLHGFGGTADTLVIDAGAVWVISAGGTVPLGSSVDFGTVIFARTITNNTNLAIENGATVELTSGMAGSGSLDFAGSGGLLLVSGTTMPANTLTGFAPGDTIDLRNVAGGAAGSATLGAGNLLTVTEGGQSYQLQMDPAQNFAAASFVLTGDSAGGTDIQVFSGTVVGSGQTLSVTAGETLSNIVVQSGGTLDVLSGGTVSGAVIEGGASEIIGSGGVDVSATVDNGGFQDVYGSAIGALILAGGSQSVEAGGSASDTMLDGVAMQTVSSGGTATGTVVSAGDEQIVLSGGVAIATTVSGGGSEIVAAGGTASGATIVGGLVDLQGGAAFSGTFGFVGPGGVLEFDSAAVSATAPITGFGLGDALDLRGMPFNSALSASVQNGALSVSSNGVTVDQLILSGVANGPLLVTSDGAGGTDVLLRSLNGITVSAGETLVVSAGQTFTDAIVLSAGTLIIASGGVAVATTIDGGGTEIVNAGGTDIDATVESAGQQEVYGAASATVVAGGGSQVVEAGGATTGAFLDGVAEQTVSSGGVASSTTVVSGDEQDVLSGGTAIATTVAGGSEIVSAGGTISGARIVGDGLLSLAAGAVASGTINFVGSGGDLQLNAATAPFAAPIEGFSPGDTLDLRALPFTSAASANYDASTHELSVTIDSTSVAQFTLLDVVPGTQFATANDGSGFTAVIALPPPPPPPPQAQLYDFVYAYNSGGASYQGTVVDDGTYGYQVGTTITTASGEYTIFADAGAAAAGSAAGTVVVSGYDYSVTGQAAATLSQAAIGSAGLGSESGGEVLGIDGVNHPFSVAAPAASPSNTLYSFVFTYAGGTAFYTGTVATAASAAPVVPNSPVGSYAVAVDGTTNEAAGTVFVDSFTLNGQSFVPGDTAVGRADGSGGLGSEADTVTIGGQNLAFSDQTEPALSGNVFTAELNEIYADVLGRAPDPSGLATYSALLESGATAASIRAIVSASPEAQNDLNGLYLQVLGREIDPTGDGTYTSYINNGASLADVQLILAQSQEAQNDIASIYQAVLNRAADPGGLVTYLGQLATGMSLETIRTIIAHSPEEQNDIAAIFQQVLDRAPSTAESSIYMGLLSNAAGGVTQQTIAGVLSHSPEAQGDLSQLFQSILGRTPDAAELAGMENELAAGSTQSSIQDQLAANGSAGGYTTIAAPDGSTVLSASAGTPTQFDFTNLGFGNDTISGFDPKNDAIMLPASLAPSFAAVQADMTSGQGNTLITFNAGQSIFLTGVPQSALTAANFLLQPGA